MANEFEVALDGDYHDTSTYHEASRDVRRQLNRYKKDTGISDEHMLLLLMKKDLEAVPEDKRSGTDNSSKVVLVVCALVCWNAMSFVAGRGATGVVNVVMWAITLVSLLGIALIYYTGVMSPYKRSVRKVNKYLKSMPEVVDFETWCESHPLKK